MNYEKKQELIQNGKISKVILLLSGPIMLNNLTQTIYNLTDTYFVSKLGDTEVAAVAFIWPIIFFIMALGIGVSIAGTTLISQYTGAKDFENSKKVAGQVISFSFIFSLVIGIVGAILAPFIIRSMGGEGEIFSYSLSFLRIIFLGMPTMYLIFSFNAIKQGQGDTVTPMKYGAYSVALNIALDPIFIFVLNLGIRGAAIATVISRGLFAVYAIYTLFKENEGIHLKLHHLKFDKLLLKIIRIGLPSSIGQSTTGLGFAVLNVFIISFGKATMAAFAIGNRINSLIFMPAMGVGSALATIVGQNLGSNNIPRAKEAIKTSTILVTIFLVAGGIIMFTIANDVIKIFTDSPSILKQGTYYMRLIAASLPLIGFYQILIGVFQGSGHTISAMLIMIGRLWLFRIPLIVLFKKFTNLGTNSVWYAMILSNGLICLIGFGLYMTGKWQKKVIKKRDYI